MDDLNRWFAAQLNTPAGSILMFLLVFLARVAIDRHTRKKAPKRKKERSEKRAVVH